MTQERKQLDRRWLWPAACLLIVGVFFTARALTRERVQIRTAVATHEPLISTTSTNGRVEPLTNYPFTSPAPTTVKAIYVKEGDHVTAGTLLMQLDDIDQRARLATAASGLKSAQATYEAAQHGGTQEELQSFQGELSRAAYDNNQAKHDYEAIEKLQATGAASPSEVYAAKQRQETTRATLGALEARKQSRYSSAELDRFRLAVADAQASYSAAKELVDRMAIHAPAAGIVYSVPVGRLEFVEQGKVVLQLADLNQVRVTAYFDEPEIGKLAAGQSASIVWDAEPGHVWHGHILRLPSTITQYTTRNVGEVSISIDDPDGKLLPATNVTVTVTMSSEANVLSVPREALHSANGRSYVFKVLGSKLVRTPVTTGAINLTQASITSGLNEGDDVAINTLTGEPIKEGMIVEQAK